MSNFITYDRWPLRRIIGAILVVASLFISPSAFAQAIASGNGMFMLGHLLGIIIWGNIIFRLLKAPDESKTWKGIPHSWLAVMLYFIIIFLMASSSLGKLTDSKLSDGDALLKQEKEQMLIKAQKGDECIARKIAAQEDMTTAADECMQEAGMTIEDQRQLMINTISMGDNMTIPERIEWCKNFLPYVWEDPSTLDEACDYTANNWQEAKTYLLEQLNDPPYATE